MGVPRLRGSRPPHRPEEVRDEDRAARGRREAEKALASFVASLETSVAADGTFAELVERWIATASPA